MIALGSNEISKVCLGANELSKVCLGATEIYSSAPPLPYDAEIEYLEGTGTQWLDTGITTTNGILMEYYGAMGESQKNIVGIWENASNRLGVFIYNAYFAGVQKSSKAEYIRVNPRANVFNNVYFDTRGTSFVFKWDGTERENSTTTGTFSSSLSIKVFYRDQFPDITKGKIRTLKLTDNNGNVVLDWKAVRVGQVGYMYDSITGTLHGNDGEDSFVLGSDL